jgi:hypothetical protein
MLLDSFLLHHLSSLHIARPILMEKTLCIILMSLALSQAAKPAIVPLFNSNTTLEPATTIDTPDALITRIGDRVRDRHAREGQFRAYDHFLSFYWEERTFGIEIIDRVAKGGKDITLNISSRTRLNGPNLRCFFAASTPWPNTITTPSPRNPANTATRRPSPKTPPNGAA